MNEEKTNLNSKFLSSNIDDLISFYSYFNDRDELINWMKNRKKSEPTLFSFEGDAEIVVVIPTADMDSHRAQNCKNQIFKGIQQIFVESVKPRDLFFNYSHNVNIGVTEALKLRPNWIIVSNDDMVQIDNPEVLRSELSKRDNNYINALFTNPLGDYHSFKRFIGVPNLIYKIVANLHPNRNRAIRYKLWEKFELKYLDALYSGPSGFASRLTYNTKKVHLLTGSFSIISRKFAERQEKLFDDTFINGAEDTDLSLRIYEDYKKIGYIDYKIGDKIGTSLGAGWPRIIRNTVNEIYLSYKIENGLLKL